MSPAKFFSLVSLACGAIACSAVTSFDRDKITSEDAVEGPADDAGTRSPEEAGMKPPEEAGAGCEGAPCQNDDGCCPGVCNANDDNDCAPVCGNGAIESGETCDPESACPTTCDDGNSCTVDSVAGSAANCDLVCTRETISRCRNDDGCCPAGCSPNNDRDCSPTCGNAVVEPGETCDPPGSCPTSCSDGNACTVDTSTGSAANCTAACSYQTITQCMAGDACCPPSCNANNDGDCSPTCGNNVLEPGETCDPPATCSTNCNDGNACTVDGSTGSVANCNFACTHQPITACQSNDGCCPAGCNANTDNNCSATCGNGVIEPNETCDPPGSCPASCNDNVACTVDTLTGSATNCTAACSNVRIVQCQSGDGCCAQGCNATTDSDCTAVCNNGVIEPGETCDPSSSCPTTCTDTNACTRDVLTGSAATCNAICSNPPITQCAGGDQCCPSSCNLNNDPDCTRRCGDGIVTPPETCDPPATPCPTSCADDGNPCTTESLTGSDATCDRACVRTPVPGCVPPDAGVDAGVDAGADAGARVGGSVDAGGDAGIDAAVDAAGAVDASGNG